MSMLRIKNKGKEIMNNQEIIKAIVKTQLEISPPIKDKVNPRFKTSYSSLDAIYASVRIPLARNGLSLSHSVETIEGKTFLVTTLRHLSGEEVSNKIPMFIENQTSQGFASALTYARRYATCTILSLPSDEDDDGEVAENPPLSESQCKEIVKLIGVNEPLLQRMLKGYGKETLKEIPASEFSAICNRLNALNAKNEAK